jgi:hypothetical protein
MIGPHEGQELEYLLNGSKKLAVFSDAAANLPNESIIPEQAFEPYVQNNTLIKSTRDLTTHKGVVIRYICYAPPAEAWRIQTFLWLKEGFYNSLWPWHSHMDALIGRLLGYSEDDIQEFVDKQTH